VSVAREVVAFAELSADDFFRVLARVAVALTAHAVSFAAAFNIGHVVSSALESIVDSVAEIFVGAFAVASEEAFWALADSARKSSDIFASRRVAFECWSAGFTAA
jgi:hypothetical protein